MNNPVSVEADSVITALTQRIAQDAITIAILTARAETAEAKLLAAAMVGEE